ncbi:MAG: hypothetical protein H0T79_16465 [Deltaproteobacteria bacterium]|nr:hypothetical protein [Deltaproteobacteria bacterium]
MCALDRAPAGMPSTIRWGARTSSRLTSARVVKPGNDAGSAASAMWNGIQNSTTVALSIPVVSHARTL